jgi:hypothetical protein
VKREKGIDSARKNIKYNQELRRYLHLLKQHKDTPFGVLVKQLDAHALEQLKDLIPDTLLQQQPQQRPPSLNSHPSSHASLPPPNQKSEDEMQGVIEEQEKEEFGTPPEKRSASGSKLKATKSTKDPRTEKVLKMIQQSPSRYNVRGTKIMNTERNRDLIGSDIKRSVECILKSCEGKWNEVTPPGTNILESKLKLNPAIHAIIEEANKTATPKRLKRTTKKPSSTLPKESIQPKSERFRPNLW